MIKNTPEQLTKVGDVTAVVTAFLSFFKAIPWPEIAAFFAAVYTAIRIVDFLWMRFVLKNHKNTED